MSGPGSSDRWQTGVMCPASRGSGLVTAAVIAMLLTACTSGTAGSSTGKTGPVATSGHAPVRPTGPARLLPGESALACGDHIDNNAQAAPLQVVLGVVALPVSPGYPALGTSLSGDGNGPLRLFAKTGLVIRPGTRFELIVPARFTSVVATTIHTSAGRPRSPRYGFRNTMVRRWRAITIRAGSRAIAPRGRRRSGRPTRTGQPGGDL